MEFRRKRYQFGCVERKRRKKGRPDVWCYRYRQLQPGGILIHRSVLIGTVAQFPTKSEAQKAAEVHRIAANPDRPAQHTVSWGALIDRYMETDLPKRLSTSRGYRSLLQNFIKPKWGGYSLGEVKPFAVEEWLRTLKRLDGSKDLAPKTKKHVRNLMQILYGCALRWGFVPIGENPFTNRLIRIENASKRTKRRSLTLRQFHQLLQHRFIKAEPYRTMVIAAVCLGLRCSELFALRWSDIDWENHAISIRRGVVRGTFDEPKTDYSRAPVPLAPELAKLLSNWMHRSPFCGSEDFVFANPNRGGKAPYDPTNIQKDRLRHAGLDIGFGEGLGWHTFRHTYRTLLDQTGAPMSAQKELMRHADIRTTFEYGEALTDTKRSANKKVVSLVFARQKGSGRKGKARK